MDTIDAANESTTLFRVDVGPEVNPASRAECVEVLEALRAWREADRTLADASKKYMHLGDTDMQAIRFIMRASQQGKVVRPSDIARFVNISAAATTKLLDRLEAGGHIARSPHPNDRRSHRIVVTDTTTRAARASVGMQHRRRLAVIAAMASDERRIVTSFLHALAVADTPVEVLSPVQAP